MLHLKPIPSLTQEDYDANEAIVKSLKERGYFNRDAVFEPGWRRSTGHAQHNYGGRIKEGVQLTELELAMICDNGYSWFGGSSRIYPDRSFAVVIYFD